MEYKFKRFEYLKCFQQIVLIFSSDEFSFIPLQMEDFLKEHESNLPLPPAEGDDTIFEFVVNQEGDWEHWSVRVPEYEYPKDSIPDYLGILVPNVDNIRTDFLIGLIAKQQKAVLLIGEQVWLTTYVSDIDFL